MIYLNMLIRLVYTFSDEHVIGAPPPRPLVYVGGGGLRSALRCLRFLRAHAPTRSLIALQTPLEWKKHFPGSNC